MRDHVVIIHRWRDRHALYEEYLDHAGVQVSYVTTELGLASVPAAATAIELVKATDQISELRKAVAALEERVGPLSRLVALNEGDLDAAAALREELGCPGQTGEQLARFRDKLTMVQAVSAGGLRAPAFADAPDIAAVAAFAEAHGWPVIVKPRRGTASRGVCRLDSAADLHLLEVLPDEPRLVQTYCGDTIYHVDGLWEGDGLGPWRASRYVNTCVDFTTGAVLGSVEEDDPTVLAAIEGFTADAAAVLGRGEPWVFHLEVFVGAEEDGGVRVTFLEAGYRVGGAEIPFVWREVHGVDLMSAAIAVQLGERPVLPPIPSGRTGGWLLFPTPVAAPCRVVGTTLRVGPAERPYAQVVPTVGAQIPKVGGYEHVGARFRFRGGSTVEVTNALLATAAGFRMECETE